MARYRTIDPAVWKHPAFLRSPWHARDVFLYLFSAHADDEGRFTWDPMAILEGAFPRSYPVDETDVASDLEHLAAHGLVVSYGNADQYGALTGWFEHQYLQRDRRSPSSLPEPPLPIVSWEAAEAIRADCAAALDRPIQQVSLHAAVDWWTGRDRTANGPETERAPAVNGALTDRSPVWVGVEGMGVGVGTGQDLSSPAATAAADGAGAQPDPVSAPTPEPEAAPVQAPAPATITDDPFADDDPAPVTTPPSAPSAEQAPPPSASPKATKPTKARASRPAVDPEQQEAELADLRAEFNAADLVALDDYLAMVRGHRANGRIALSVEVNTTRDLLKLRSETGMTSEAFAHGISAAIRANADAVNYAAKAARNYNPQARASPLHQTNGAGAADAYYRHTMKPQEPEGGRKAKIWTVATDNGYEQREVS